jgi:hypothetical protein
MVQNAPKDTFLRAHSLVSNGLLYLIEKGGGGGGIRRVFFLGGIGGGGGGGVPVPQFIHSFIHSRNCSTAFENIL